MKPRQIADEMQREMERAAAKVWQQRQGEIPVEHREEWKGLCKRHVANHLSREWGQG